MELNINELLLEVQEYVSGIEVGDEGEHLWDNYQRVTEVCKRLQEIHNQIAWLEIVGQASPELKKFRTLIVDPTIERFEKIATFESRKMTGRQIEFEMERR